MIDSDWKDYWSSSDILKEWIEKDGVTHFKREILLFTETAAQTLYGEECILYHTNAILDDKCLNNNIRAKVYRKWFSDVKNDKFKADIKMLKSIL